MIFFFILLSKIQILCIQQRFFFLQLLMILVVLFFFFLQNFQIIIQFLSVELIQSFHFFIALLQVLYIVFHFYFSGGISLHALDPKLFNGPLKLLLLPSSAQWKRCLHVNMLFEALLDLISRLFNVPFSFLLESPLNLIQLLNALISQCEILLSHFTYEQLNVTWLLFQSFWILVILFL